MCYMNAQDKIYVHKSNGTIEAIALTQLDSLSFVTTSADLQITTESDTVRVGQAVAAQTNILEGSMMDIAWGTRDHQIISVSGSYNTGSVKGLYPGKATIQATCDGLVTTKPITVIGRATSTGAPKVDWDVTSLEINSGDNVAFAAQYDSKNSPVDYTAVWYDIMAVEEKKVSCPLIKAFNYVYTQNGVSKTIQNMTEYQRYEHDANSWTESTQSYVNNDHFSVVLNDTLGTIEWKNPTDTINFALKIKTYFGENFPSEFKRSLTERLNEGGNRHYGAYMNVFQAFSYLTDTIKTLNGDKMPYITWMIDSTFNANSNTWNKHFKQYDTIWSKTKFDTLGVRIDTTYKITVTGRPPKRDTTWFYNTIYITKPWVDDVVYVYDQIVERIDRVWNDSVSFLDLLRGPDGYEVEYKRNHQINAEYRVYDTQGNLDKTTPHNIVVENKVEKIKVIADADPIIVRETPVSLQIGKYYTNRQGSKQYQWIFPAGTKTVTGEDISTYTGETTPELLFSHVGSLPITIQLTINGVRQPDEIVKLNVGYNQEVPTLYYAEAGGNIKAYKLTDHRHYDMKIMPFDLGVRTQHAFNLLFKDSLLYVLDAGKQFYFVDDVDGKLGDGKISVLSKDGSKVETMISNVGGPAFQDPFYGYVEGDDLYYADRNTGIIKLPLSARNQVYNTSTHPYFVQQNTLGYYNNGWGYGSIGGMFGKINGVWHWTKFYNANGIFRFEDSDILPATIAQGDASNRPAAGIMLDGMWHKSFVYVPKHDKMVLHIMDAGYNGIYAATYDEFNAVGSSRNSMKPYAVTYNGMMFESNTTGNLPAKEGTGSESVGITQMVYDEINDCVYFAYRNNSYYQDHLPPTGIYSYNVATGWVTCLIEGVEAYGIAINNQPSKLF